MTQRKGTSPTYAQNKPHIYNYISKNRDRVNIHKLRTYYKSKIDNKDWANIKYIFLDILICDVA